MVSRLHWKNTSKDKQKHWKAWIASPISLSTHWPMAVVTLMKRQNEIMMPKFKPLLERCCQRNLKLNVKKLRCKEKTVPFMGHVLTSTGVQPDPAKVQAIVSMPEPEDARAAQRFLGMVNYVSKFCPDLSAICKPVRNYLYNDNVPWAESQQAAFKEAKELIASAPTLNYYDVTQTCMLQVDTSEYGLGAALLQHGQPVAFASRSLSEGERWYAQIEKECLTICFGMIRFDQ